MKKILFTLSLLAATLTAAAQNTQDAAAAAAAALSAAEDVPEKAEKPKYWTNSVLTNINFGQTWLENWVAGGYNTVTLAGNVDGKASYAKDKIIWNSRLQMDYGFLYSADKPIVQKNKDRFYLESKLGYETSIRNVAFSASFDFKTQFGDNYNYKTPTDAQFEAHPGDVAAAWREAALNNLKSGFFAPAYLNLGIGFLWTPVPWFSLNIAPLSGGAVFVTIPELRYTYGMGLKENSAYATPKEAYQDRKFDDFLWARLEFGSQIKADLAWVINEAFSYTTQITLFYNYLTYNVEPRITWDNKVFWKLAKYFALTVSTNMIYDPCVVVRDSDNDGKPDAKGIQFKEFVEFGFTYTIATKK